MQKQSLIVVVLLAGMLDSKPTAKRSQDMHKMNIDMFVDNKTMQPQERILNPTYPNSEFIAYAEVCDFNGYDLYTINNVLDAIACGSKFCYGDKKCTHFTYDSADINKPCALKSVYGASTSLWISNHDTRTCGLLPIRACDINRSTIPELLGCLSRNYQEW